MPQGRVPDRRKSVVCSLLRVLQRRSKIFHSVLHAKGRRPCQKARKPHLTHCRSIYYICIYQTFPDFCGMKKDFNTGLRKGIEADRVKLTRRRKLLLREMGGQPHTMAFQHYRSHSCVPVVCTGFAQGTKKQNSRAVL